MRYPSQRVFLVSAMLLVTLASLPAQIVSGTVIGLDKNAIGATVAVLDLQKRVMGEVVVGADGEFTYRGERSVGSIVVRQEAVAVTRGVVGGGDVGVTIDLTRSVTWIRTVNVLDPAGQPAVGLDVMLRGPGEKTLSCATVGPMGWLEVRGNQPVESLLVDPLGWQHAVPVRFKSSKIPRDTIPDLVIDMRPHAHKFVLLQGCIVDLEGQAVGGARVVASKKVNGKILPCGFTKANGDGSFRMWTSLAASKLTATSSGTTWEQRGDWSDGGVQIVNLDERQDGVVMVTGCVRDREDNPVRDAVIHASEVARIVKGSRGIAATDLRGQFRVFVRRATPFLVADLHDGGGIASTAGPWPQENVVLDEHK